VPDLRYHAFVDMSGGSSDDAVLCVAHREDRVAVIDCIEKQSGSPPFNPRDAIRKFAGILKSYGITSVTGDAFAGQTFRAEFQQFAIGYNACGRTKSDLYELLEPALNAGEVELLDSPRLTEQLVCLVWRGARIDHEPNAHDDFANTAAGVVYLVRARSETLAMHDPIAGVAPRAYLGDDPEASYDALTASAAIVNPATISPWAEFNREGTGGIDISLRHLGIP
jgi:hypothetical protein